MATQSLPYMPRLDGLRAVAIFGVLAEHFVPLAHVRQLSPGGAGVTLFFVLSGYLITRILLNYRDMPLGAAAAHFYWRRLLRLSPPFYLALLLAAVLDLPGMREQWWIHALYLTNVEIGLAGQWGESANHFWSLCTEEQFYIVWFLVAVAAPRRFLLGEILACLVLSLAFRSWVYVSGIPTLATVLLPGNLASLAAGALLAEAQISPRLRGLWRATSSRGWLLGSTTAFALLSLSMPLIDWPRAIFYPFVASAFAMGVVSASVRDEAGPWLEWLAWQPLRHVGKISYGIYVYHMFLPDMLTKLVGARWMVLGRWGEFFLLVVLSIVVAQLSWTLMERPILRCRGIFETRAATRTRAALQTAS